MATKKLKKKVQRKPAVRKVENPVVDSARDIWLAGLGAFSVAQKEGERFIEESNKLFDKLVKEGSKLESKTRKDVEGAFGDLRGEFESRVKNFRGDVESRVEELRDEVENRFGGMRKQRETLEKQADDFRKQANEGWDKLEGFFEDRVKRVLARVGMPTRDDIDRLNRRVQDLSRTVAELEKPAKVNKAAPKKAAPKKAAVKKSVAKKVAPKKKAVKKAAVSKVASARPETPVAPETAKAA